MAYEIYEQTSNSQAEDSYVDEAPQSVVQQPLPPSPDNNRKNKKKIRNLVLMIILIAVASHLSFGVMAYLLWDNIMGIRYEEMPYNMGIRYEEMPYNYEALDTTVACSVECASEASPIENLFTEEEYDSGSKLAGREWLKGVWAGEYDGQFGRMVVTNSYIKVINSNHNTAFQNVENQSRQDYDIRLHSNYVLDQEIFGFDSFIGIDEGSKQIYLITGEYSRIYLNKISNEISTEALQMANTKYPKRVYSNAYDGFVNVRIEPKGNGTIVDIVRNGPEGAIFLGTTGNWVRVQTVNGVEGYAFSKYVQYTPTPYFD